jgi:alpha-beta hydrolase superfamily lysophospholipase
MAGDWKWTDLPGVEPDAYRAGDGYRLRYMHYKPRTPARATIVCIHGIQSHALWYVNSCVHLFQAGYEVCFLDRRGSGPNEEARGDAPSFRRLLDDIAEFLRKRRGERPIVLVAVSWGGKLGAALQRRHPGLVDALALLCPGFRPVVDLSLGQRLAVVASRLVTPRRLFDVPLSDPELFTANPEWVRFIRDDPLALRRATARLLVESARLDGYLRWFPPRLTVPVLLMLAGRDRIIDNARTRAFVDRLAPGGVEVIEYPDAHHTLEFEPGMPFVADLLAWLGRVTA